MAKRRPRDLLLAVGLIVGTIEFGGGTAALAQGTIPGLTSTPITFSGHADAFVAGPDGNVWLVDSTANAVGRLAVDGSAYKAFTVPTPSAGLQSITVGPDGNLWFTESFTSKVGRITTSGAFTEFAVPGAFHFVSPVLVATGSIFPGPDGNLWISGQGQMAKVTPQGTVTVVTVPPPQGVALLSIGKCVVGSDNNFWCQSAGNDTIDRTAKLTTSGAVTLYPGQGQSFDFIEGPDGNVWYVSQGTPPASITRITPAGVETVYTLPTHSYSQGLAVGADGNLWFTERSTMGNIWQMILSTATDDGHATFNSAAITTSYPEGIIPVSSPAHVSGIRTEQATATGCQGGGDSFGVISSAQYGANFTWCKTEAPTTCTDLHATGWLGLRYLDLRGEAGVAACTNVTPISRDPALDVVLDISLPAGSRIDLTDRNADDPHSWTDCVIQGSGESLPVIECTAPSIAWNETRTIRFLGAFTMGKGRATCKTSTFDIDHENDSVPLEHPPLPTATYDSVNRKTRGH